MAFFEQSGEHRPHYRGKKKIYFLKIQKNIMNMFYNMLLRFGADYIKERCLKMSNFLSI